ASGAEGRRFDSFRGHVSNNPTSKRTYLLRRVAVFGAAIILLLVILKLLAGLLSPESTSVDSAPIPIPVATPVFDCATNTPLPQTFIDAWVMEYGAVDFNATVIDLVENCSYSMGELASVFPTASTGKLIIATGVLELVGAGTLDFSSVESDLTLMITQSDNNAADRLFDVMGRNDAVISIGERYGLTSTTTGGAWGTILTNSLDQANLLNQVIGTQDSALPQAQRVILRDLLTKVNPQQAWGAGSVTIPDWTIAVKNGWYLSVPGDRPPEGLWRINTLGYVWDQEDKPRWIFTGYSNTWKTEERGISAWNAVSTQLSNSLGIR
ncbi:MAG: serine hydrolase, partial [Actinomycetes bacterium]